MVRGVESRGLRGLVDYRWAAGNGGWVDLDVDGHGHGMRWVRRNGKEDGV